MLCYVLFYVMLCYVILEIKGYDTIVSESPTCHVVVATAAVVHFDSNQLDQFLDKEARVFGDTREISLFFAENIAHAELWIGQCFQWYYVKYSSHQINVLLPFLEQ